MTTVVVHNVKLRNSMDEPINPLDSLIKSDMIGVSPGKIYIMCAEQRMTDVPLVRKLICSVDRHIINTLDDCSHEMCFNSLLGTTSILGCSPSMVPVILCDSFAMRDGRVHVEKLVFDGGFYNSDLYTQYDPVNIVILCVKFIIAGTSKHSIRFTQLTMEQVILRILHTNYDTLLISAAITDINIQAIVEPHLSGVIPDRDTYLIVSAVRYKINMRRLDKVLEQLSVLRFTKTDVAILPMIVLAPTRIIYILNVLFNALYVGRFPTLVELYCSCPDIHIAANVMSAITHAIGVERFKLTRLLEYVK